MITFAPFKLPVQATKGMVVNCIWKCIFKSSYHFLDMRVPVEVTKCLMVNCVHKWILKSSCQFWVCGFPYWIWERANGKLGSQGDAFSDSPTYTSEQDNTIGEQGLHRGKRRPVIPWYKQESCKGNKKMPIHDRVQRTRNRTGKTKWDTKISNKGQMIRAWAYK